MSRAVTEVTTIKDMSPEQAKAELKSMASTYQIESRTSKLNDAKLKDMLKNPLFLQGIEHGGEHGGSNGVALPGGPLFDQVQAAVAEFHAENSPIDLAMAGYLGDINDSGYLEQKRTVDALRADGIADGAIRQLIGNEPVSRSEFERVQAWKSAAMENPEFTAAYLKGDPASVRMMTNANIVLTSPIKGDA